MRVTAIIQARMGATRLPGKVLLPVLGRPLLAYLVERLGRCRSLTEIVLATTDQDRDDPVAEFARSSGVRLFRGSEADVLDRYYQAAAQVRAEQVMRITADCPLLDPMVCDRVVAEHEAAGADYSGSDPSFAEGLDCEVVSFQALERSWREAQLKSEREHVTLHVRNHPERFHCHAVRNATDHSGYRVTVDNPEDYLVVKAVLEALYPARPTFGFAEVKEFLDAHPEIFELNCAIVRNEGLVKSLREDEILIPQGPRGAS